MIFKKLSLLLWHVFVSIIWYKRIRNESLILSRVLVTSKWGVALVNLFSGYPIVVTTNNYSTLKITVIITHVKSHNKSSQVDFQFFLNYELLVAVSYRQRALSYSVSQSQSQSHIATDDQSVNKFGVESHLMLVTALFFFFAGRHLWREDGSVICTCCWPFPAQSFSGPSPLGLATIFYCLRFETSPFVAFYDSQDHGGGHPGPEI
jgi:hypothetical protein